MQNLRQTSGINLTQQQSDNSVRECNEDILDLSKQLTTIFKFKCANNPVVSQYFAANGQLLQLICQLFNSLTQLSEYEPELVLAQKLMALVYLNLMEIQKNNPSA